MMDPRHTSATMGPSQPFVVRTTLAHTVARSLALSLFVRVGQGL
jgi:hypothetical protein